MNKQIKKMKKCSANDLVKRRFMLLQAWEPRATKVIKSYFRVNPLVAPLNLESLHIVPQSEVLPQQIK